MDCGLSMGFPLAGILEWVAISFSRGDLHHAGFEPRPLEVQAVSCIAEPPGEDGGGGPLAVKL